MFNYCCAAGIIVKDSSGIVWSSDYNVSFFSAAEFLQKNSSNTSWLFKRLTGFEYKDLNKELMSINPDQQC